MPGNPLTDPNWPADTTNTIVRLVGAVRDQTTAKAVFAARAIVYGIIAAFLGLFILVLLLIGILRGLEAALDTVVSQPQAVYLSYFIVGAALCIAGFVFFAKRRTTPT
jgi:hypothetical protein